MQGAVECGPIAEERVSLMPSLSTQQSGRVAFGWGMDESSLSRLEGGVKQVDKLLR